MTPVTFQVSFIASVFPEYVNYGVNGYRIGETKFRSIASMTTAFETAFGKDIGPYLGLEAQITYFANGEQHQAICTSDNYQDVLTAIESTLTEEKVTIESLLDE